MPAAKSASPEGRLHVVRRVTGTRMMPAAAASASFASVAVTGFAMIGARVTSSRPSCSGVRPSVDAIRPPGLRSGASAAPSPAKCRTASMPRGVLLRHSGGDVLAIVDDVVGAVVADECDLVIDARGGDDVRAARL